jgi:hypothetical protein
MSDSLSNTGRLGRLSKVDLRAVWASEPKNFTPWLAKEENLFLLGETLGIQLELEATETSVGPFAADILCRDPETDSLVVVENQLERTDHTHLGQIITYAAGLDAVTVIWIASAMTEEHRAWLQPSLTRPHHVERLDDCARVTQSHGNRGL